MAAADRHALGWHLIGSTTARLSVNPSAGWWRTARVYFLAFLSAAVRAQPEPFLTAKLATHPAASWQRWCNVDTAALSAAVVFFAGIWIIEPGMWHPLNGQIATGVAYVFYSYCFNSERYRQAPRGNVGP